MCRTSRQNEAPAQSLGRAGAGLGCRSRKSERMCRSGLKNGAIVRFPQCDISAMTLLCQHTNQHFSVGTKALATRLLGAMEPSPALPLFIVGEGGAFRTVARLRASL